MFFRDNYDFLSNMYTCTINVPFRGDIFTFSCAESAFQAFKCPERMQEFTSIDGFTAKKLGRKVKLREDWEQQKVAIMFTIVKAKFEQNPDLMEKLINVNGIIAEENTWNDTYWGICNGTGLNRLGLILMAIRDANRPRKTVCFTGRRPKDLCGYNHDAYIPLVEHLKKELRNLYCQGYNMFISGGAQGFDQLAFWAVNALKREGLPVINIVYVPFRGQEKQWANNGLFSKAEYNLMLSLADEVVYLQETLHDRQAIVNALYDRNHKMVGNADLVVALYPNDNWQASNGGTAECMRYASENGKEIKQIRYYANLTEFETVSIN